MDTRIRRQAVLLTFAIFALHPFALGGWLAFIPLVKETLALNKAELAIGLLGLPVATIPSMQLASRLVSRFGPRRVMAAAFPFQAVVVLLPLLAANLVTLFLGLMAFGVAMALLQVCLNVYAGRLEKALGHSVMNRCHGFWGLGLMIGPVLVAAFGTAPPLLVLALIAGVSSVLAMIAALSLPALPGDEVSGPSPRRRLRDVPLALAAISIFALAIAMTEGAMADWAAVYLAERLPPGATTAGLGVSVYAAFLAAGRMSGDWLKNRIGAVTLARLTIGLAIGGLLLLILPLPLAAAYVGFALVGAGASVGFPLGVSAAAALDDRFEGSNIAIMSSVAICGFLIGPPLIGFLAEAFSLQIGLSALLPGLVLGLWLCGALSARERPQGHG